MKKRASRQIRLCFYNPHSINNTLGETVLSRLAQVFGTDKKKLKTHNLRHRYLLDLMCDSRINTAIVIDGLGTSFDAILGKNKFFQSYFLRNLISKLEIILWCLINGLNLREVSIISDINRLDPKSDILFSFGYCSDMFANNKLIDLSIFSNFKGSRVVHLTHYYGRTKIVASNLRKIGVDSIVAESNLTNNPYFKRHFSFIDNVIVLPHVLREKYKRNKTFSKRISRCLALGTLVINQPGDPVNKDYTDFFKIDTLHPMRKAIYQNQAKLKGYVDSLISFHNQKRLEVQKKSTWYQSSSFFRMIYDLFFLSESKQYHDLDIVSKYNEYKMFVSPEENIGLPSVNFIEGMACGCAYLGLDSSMYTDLGMKDKREFIAYNGTVEDLKEKISYYQKHPKDLAQIALRGYRFATAHFNVSKVTDNFIKDLSKL